MTVLTDQVSCVRTMWAISGGMDILTEGLFMLHSFFTLKNIDSKLFPCLKVML